MLRVGVLQKSSPAKHGSRWELGVNHEDTLNERGARSKGRNKMIGNDLSSTDYVHRLQGDWVDLIINGELHPINLSIVAGLNYSGAGISMILAGQTMHIPMNRSNYQHFWQLVKLGQREIKFTDEVFAAVTAQVQAKKEKDKKDAEEEEEINRPPKRKDS